MTTPIWKKALIVTAMVAPLTLAACGKEDNKEKAETTTSTSTSATSTKTVAPTSTEKTSSTEPTTSEETTTEETTTEETTTVEETTVEETTTEVAAPPTSSSEAPSTVSATATSAASNTPGVKATPEQLAAFKNALKGVEFRPDMNRKQYMLGVLKNTCTQLLDAQFGPGTDRAALINQVQAIPDETFDMMAQTVLGAQASALTPENSPIVVGVSDGYIDGNKATAQASFKKNGQDVTIPYNFVKEDNTWRLCS